MSAHSRFEEFARVFVLKYWETIKSGAFPMPPDEPVEETIEALLAQVSHETESIQPSSGKGSLYRLRLNSTHGNWWLFTFRQSSRAWVLCGCSASSDDDERPHDLLGPIYAAYFRPFLQHVTNVANSRMSR